MSYGLCVKAKLIFLSRDEGGRRFPVIDSPNYRPHIVIGDPLQRQALIDSQGNCTETEKYLGVCFQGDGRQLVAGKEYEVVFGLVYYPEVDYSAVVSGATFTVREGSTIVAYGTIIGDV